jgi:phage-related protein
VIILLQAHPADRGATIVLLSAFLKKTMKTPHTELGRALTYMKDFERRHSDET